MRKNLETQNVDIDNEFVSLFLCVAEVSRIQNELLIEIILRDNLPQFMLSYLKCLIYDCADSNHMASAIQKTFS